MRAVFQEKISLLQSNSCRQENVISCFEEGTSALDIAAEACAAGTLRCWDSVIVGMQTKGRGQFRRHWESPVGNLYAALRLPQENSCSGDSVTPFLGLACARAIRKMGWPIRLKWPNDLMLNRSAPIKIGGVLLEEKAGALIAGIGINLLSAPKANSLRANAASRAGHLPSSGNFSLSPLAFWKKFLVLFNHYFYENAQGGENWRKDYDELLLWRGKKIEIVDGKDKYAGVLLGLAPNGGVELSRDGQNYIAYNGSMKIAE